MLWPNSSYKKIIPFPLLKLWTNTVPSDPLDQGQSQIPTWLPSSIFLPCDFCHLKQDRLDQVVWSLSCLTPTHTSGSQQESQFPFPLCGWGCFLSRTPVTLYTTALSNEAPLGDWGSSPAKTSLVLTPLGWCPIPPNALPLPARPWLPAVMLSLLMKLIWRVILLASSKQLPPSYNRPSSDQAPFFASVWVRILPTLKSVTMPNPHFYWPSPVVQGPRNPG